MAQALLPTVIHKEITHTELVGICLQHKIMHSRSEGQFNWNYTPQGEGATNCRSRLSLRAGLGHKLTFLAGFSISVSKLWSYHLECTEPESTAGGSHIMLLVPDSDL